MIRILALQACTVLALAAAPELAHARLHPFVVVGGQASKAEKDDVDKLLDPITIHQSSGSWEAGGGLQFNTGHNAATNADGPVDIGLRLTYGRGTLPDESFSGTRSDFSYHHSYEVSYTESFHYTGWTAGALFSYRVLPHGGFYLGPVLQTANFKAERSWEGPTDCFECGPASDKSMTRYGQLELGANAIPFNVPLRIEGYWIPWRRELSTTHIVQSDIYTANFSALKNALGMRLAYQF